MSPICAFQVKRCLYSSQSYSYIHDPIKYPPYWQRTQTSAHHFLSKYCSQEAVLKMMGRNSSPRDSSGRASLLQTSAKGSQPWVACCLSGSLWAVPLSAQLGLFIQAWTMENDKGMHIPRSMHISKNQELDPYETQTRHPLLSFMRLLICFYVLI